MTKLTPEQQQVAQAWLHDVFIAGGVSTNNRRANPDLTLNSPQVYYSTSRASIEKAAKTVCDAISFRQVSIADFSNLDAALDELSRYRFFTDLSANRRSDTRFIRKQAPQLAKYIANFCAQNELYWDDSNVSGIDRARIETSSTIGVALKEFGCFVSQPMVTKKVRNSSTSTATGTATSAPKTPGTPPQNGYKASGPHSQDIPNLIGSPNQKITLNASEVYCIIADKIGKNTPNLYITPLNQNGGRVSLRDAEKLKFGSGNGYTDCTLWFTDKVQASNIIQAITANPDLGAKYQNVRLLTKAPDPNGYFAVTTDIGNAYIKAIKLNEDLEEDLIENQNKKQDRYDIQDIDAFDEAFRKYYN